MQRAAAPNWGGNSTYVKVCDPTYQSGEMNSWITHVPPGFRFHPTDEELVDYYLRKKVCNKKIDLNVIKDVDLYKIEPWDLEDLCRITSEEQNEWYFFSHKDKKYPTGTRTNRATKAGFWKATGRDKAIYSRHCLVGMRKTLVFYKGRAPNGLKSDWIMHEYRLETNENCTAQEEGWLVCRVFKKRMAVMHKMGEHGSPRWYDHQVSFVQEIESPSRRISHLYASYHQHYPCKQDSEVQYSIPQVDAFLQSPQPESPTVPRSGQSLGYSLIPYSYERNSSTSPLKCTTFSQENHTQYFHPQTLSSILSNNVNQVIGVTVSDWRALGNCVPSHLSHDQGDSKEANAAVLDVAEQIKIVSNVSKRSELTHAYGSTSDTSYPIELWK